MTQPAGPRPGRHRRRRRHRLQHRLPPGSPRLDRHRAAGAEPAHGGHHWHAAGLITSAGMTDETALFFSRYSRDLYARLEEETGPLDRFPAGGPHLARDLAAAAGGAAARGGVDARVRRRGHRDLAARAGRDVAAGQDRRRAVGVLRRRRGPRRPGRRGDLAGQGGQAARRDRDRRRRGHRRADERAGSPACSPSRARSRPRSWSTRPGCGRASSARWPGCTCRCRPPSTTTC